MGVRSQRLRDSARGRDCTLRFPGICNRDSETTVLAHLPSPVKGMGTKGDDWHACFACSACHEHMDLNQKHKNMAGYQLRALQQTQRQWFEEGLLVLSRSSRRVQRRLSKSLPFKPSWRMR